MTLWLRVAERQKERVLAVGASELDRMGDAILLAIAFRNVQRAAEAADAKDFFPGLTGAALAMFRERVPDLREIRDSLEHSDAYFLGEGTRQKKGTFGNWSFSLTNDGGGGVVLKIGSLSVELVSAYDAATDLYRQMFAIFTAALDAEKRPS